jgi:hypothetical protein
VLPVLLRVSALITDFVVEGSEEKGIRQLVATLEARRTVGFDDRSRLTFDLQFEALAGAVDVFFDEKSGIRVYLPSVLNNFFFFVTDKLYLVCVPSKLFHLLMGKTGKEREETCPGKMSVA